MDVNHECCQFCNRVHEHNPCEFCGTSIPLDTPETPERFSLMTDTPLTGPRSMEDMVQWRKMDKAVRPSRAVRR